MSEAKVALITGSSSGIGASTVKLFSKRGYKVVVTGSKQEKVDQVAAECLAISPQKFEVSFELNIICQSSDHLL